ncbi:type II toxin-antitoxin system VapB family antitoxin [Spirosoma luteum]|uniref:type II toxin-antitoxin system VapB family antitoxin n=1 Tax=Spirosoma luteum TaxID=431553 RepID=UPI000367C50E|nr:type II toxin-antitoxin system VapB family antitoxin [Spirosoma luteum]
METNIKLDDRLLDKAKQLSHIQNTDEVVRYALEQYVVKAQAFKQLLDMRGKVSFWGDEGTASAQ